ncbi:energy transducer TonB [Luteimonas pelagia]
MKPESRARATGRLCAVAVLALAIAACGKDEDGQAAQDGQAATADQAASEAPPQAVSDTVAAMSPEELREAASVALREQRLYAPAGDNAVEYYLALRDKQPEDPAVASALTDLMPYTLIATEQSIGREDFAEAQRLYALMEKADADAPALPRLRQSIADAQAEVAQRAEAEEARSEEEDRRQAEVQAERQREQEAAQQRAAAELAAQQQAAREAEERRQAEAAAAARAQQQAAAQPPPAPTQAAPSRPANTELVAVSTPAPSFPVEAYRNRQSGEVQVEFTVGTNGSVTSSRVVRSNPRRVFDRAALDAVNSWRFQPVAEPITSRRTIEFAPQN